MKRISLGMVFLLVCLPVLIMSTPSSAYAALDEQMPSVEGTYKVVATIHAKYNYSTKISVLDLGDGKIKVLGRFDGIPLAAVGYQTKQLSSGPVYDLKINIPELFNGTAIANFIYENGNYRLQAEGSGTYNFEGMTGHSSAGISGRRIDATSPSPGIAGQAFALFGTMFHSPFYYVSGLIVILLLAFLILRSRIKKNSGL